MTEALANFCDKKPKANHKSEFLLDKQELKERSRKSEQKLTMITITFPIKKKKKKLVKYVSNLVSVSLYYLSRRLLPRKDKLGCNFSKFQQECLCSSHDKGTPIDSV
jgi:hypothetical protein